MKKFFTKLLTVICVIVICISGYNIFITLRNYKKADDVYSVVREAKEEAEDEEEVEDTKKDNTEDKDTKESDEESDTSASFKKLSSANSDYRFWIKVEGTNIDYPVVQGEDNSFYLDHDFNKNYLAAGSIFLDYRNDFKTDTNSVIYGHHMRNSTMFGQMEKFKNKDFFDNNKTITITDEDGTHEYEIFAIGVYEADFPYRDINFESEKDFKNFLNNITSNAMYSRDIVEYGDHMITLSTCSYEFDDARIGLFAVKK